MSMCVIATSVFFRTFFRGCYKSFFSISTFMALLALLPSAAGAQRLIVDVTDPDLDMDRQITAHQAEVTPLVEKGPQLVVGQGDDSNNYTLVRCLSEYGVPYVQFMAYASAVRGGVNVCAGELTTDTGLEIVTCPISSTTSKMVRVFTNTGLLKYEWQPSTPLAAPFCIAVADFLSSHSGDEIAVVQRVPTGSSRVRFYDVAGTVLADYATPFSPAISGEKVKISPLHVLTGGDRLLIGYPGSGWVYVMTPSTGASVAHETSSVGSFDYLGEGSVFGDLFAVGKSYPSTGSLVWSGFGGGLRSIDVGTREKCFFVNLTDYAGWPDAQYVKNTRFLHLRTDGASPGFSNPQWDNNDYNFWAGGSFVNYINTVQADYFTALRTMWEPCFTHRSGNSPWYSKTDPATGQYQYAMLTRLNNRAVSGDSPGVDTFSNMSYALNLPMLDHLYIWPLRAFLIELAAKFRGESGDPDKLVALEPNHEMEVQMSNDNTLGDYNPAMISGFYSDLIRRYSKLAKINTKLGTSFTAATFDAPRNTGRGTWDAYSTSNAFFNAWVEYNRKVVLTRVAQSEREAFLAGFPPSIVRTHQIPANYAVGPVISAGRITPLDWTLTGPAGYGGTRYGLWYTDTNNFIQGARSSGFNMINIGEYQPLTTDQNAANAQAEYLFNNGVAFVNDMPAYYPMDVISKSAFARLQDLGPRPLTADGIGQIRAARQQTLSGAIKDYGLVCMGRTGLIKSVNPDGSMEGTVYVEPFRQRINVTALKESQSFTLYRSDYTIGPVTGLKAGDQIDISFKARCANANPQLTLLLLHDGVEIPNHRTNVTLTSTDQFYRYTLRVNEPMDGITILMNSGQRDASTAYTQTIAVSSYSALVERIQVARIEYGVTTGAANTGAVTFDVLSAANIPDGRLGSCVSMMIMYAHPYVDSTEVELEMDTIDPSAVSQMRFSNDNINWSGWESYTTTKQWSMLPGDGAKKVYAQFLGSTGQALPSAVAATTVDSTGPIGTIGINSGELYTTLPSVTLLLDAVDDGCGVSGMRFSNTGSDWITWEAYGAAKAWTLSSVDGINQVYVQYRDLLGNLTTVSTSIILDTTAPSAPGTPTDAGAYTNSTSVTFNWSAAIDAASGISSYYCEIGTTPGGSDVFSGNVADALSWVITGAYGKTYYCRTRATDKVGYQGPWSGNSDGIMVVRNSGVSISEAKAFSDTESAGLDAKAVSAIYGDYFYIEEPTRFAGIRVQPIDGIPAGLAPGSLVDIGGVLNTNTDQERWLSANVKVLSGNSSILPLAVTNRWLGGGDTNGQKGIAGATGLNNIGLLVKTTGLVTPLDSTSFMINDGSGVSAKVIVPSGVAVPSAGSFVTVTGVSSCYASGTDLVRLVLVRTDNDLVVVK